MPDFQQRVDMLKQLEYIAADNTVQLKVCIVSVDSVQAVKI